MYLIQRLTNEQKAKYRRRSQMAINGLYAALQKSKEIASLPNIDAKWKYIAERMGFQQEGGNSFYNYFVSLNKDILFLIRNGNHNNTNENFYNIHEQLGRPNKRYIVFFKGIGECLDISTNFLEAEHHTISYPVNSLDTVESVRKYIHAYIRLFANGKTKFPKLPSIIKQQRIKQIDNNINIKSKQMKENRIRLTEVQLRNIIMESVRKVLKEGYVNNVPANWKNTEFHGTYEDEDGAIYMPDDAMEGYEYMIVTYDGRDVINRERVILPKSGLHAYDDEVPFTLGSNQALIELD